MRVIFLLFGAIYLIIDAYRVLTNKKEWDPNKHSRRWGMNVTNVDKFKKTSSFQKIFWGILCISLVLIVIFQGSINKYKWTWIWLFTMLGGQIIFFIITLRYIEWERLDE